MGENPKPLGRNCAAAEKPPCACLCWRAAAEIRLGAGAMSLMMTGNGGGPATTTGGGHDDRERRGTRQADLRKRNVRTQVGHQRPRNHVMVA